MIETYLVAELALRVEEPGNGLWDGCGDLGGRAGREAVGGFGRDGRRVRVDGPGVENFGDDLSGGCGGRGGGKLSHDRTEDAGEHVAGAGSRGIGMAGIEGVLRLAGCGDAGEAAFEQDDAVQFLG